MWSFFKKHYDIPRKTLKSGFSMPQYGLGTWHIGGSWEPGPKDEDSPDILAMREMVDRGVNSIDTAEIYGSGNTEKLVGHALKGGRRVRVFLTSKVFENNYTYDGVIEACKQSLERLKTDYLDLYLLHRYHKDLPTLMRAMDTLKSEGMVRDIGVSNFGVEHLKEAQSYTKNKIVCNQVHYNLEFREPEVAGLLAYCQENDVMLTAYRALQRGALGTEAPEILLAMAKKYNKTPAQVALNWLLAQENVVVLAKTRSFEHLDENMGALHWALSQEDVELLRREYPNQQTVSNAVPLG